MPRLANWIVPLVIAALLGAAVALWLERGNAIMLDLSSGIAAFLCL